MYFFFLKENIIKLNIINFGQWLVLMEKRGLMDLICFNENPTILFAITPFDTTKKIKYFFKANKILKLIYTSTEKKKKKYYVDFHRHLTRFGVLIILIYKIAGSRWSKYKFEGPNKLLFSHFFILFFSYKENKQNLYSSSQMLDKLKQLLQNLPQIPYLQSIP